MLWLVPGLTLTKSKIYSGELTDKYHRMYRCGKSNSEMSLCVRALCVGVRGWQKARNKAVNDDSRRTFNLVTVT